MRAVVRLDKQVCRGTGLCQAMSPDLFRLAGDGFAEPVEPELRDGERIALAREVEECCPTGAIEIVAASDEAGAPLR